MSNLDLEAPQIAEISTPYTKYYHTKDVNETGLTNNDVHERDGLATNMYNEIEERCTAGGMTNPFMMRSEFEKIAGSEAGKTGWLGSRDAFQYYTTIVGEDRAGLVGSHWFHQEMARAHLSYLLHHAPTKEKVGFIKSFLKMNLRENVNLFFPPDY